MSNGAPPGRWLHRGALAVLLAAGAAAVYYRITAPSMWIDEVAARADGLGPLRMLLRHHDPHVTSSHVYHLASRACEWLTGDIHLGNRLPQALAAWGSLVFVYFLARGCYSPGAGLLAVLLLITHPFFIRYAQENRLQQMVSCGMLASLYFSLRYVEQRRVWQLAGFIISMALLVRCGYGVVPLLVLCALWPALYAMRRGTAARVEGRAVAEWYAAVVVVLALWLPYPLMFARAMMAQGILSGLTRGLRQLDVFWQGKVALTPHEVLAYCRQHFAEALDWRAGLLLCAVALAGSMRYRRGLAWCVVVFGLLETLVSFYVMNAAGGAVVPRRYVYLCPLTMLVIAGGVAMAVACGTDLCGTFLTRVAGMSSGCVERLVRWWLRPFLWAVLSMAVCWPVLCDHAYQLSQYYVTDRHVYRTMAHVLNTHAAAGAEVISVDTDMRDWALSMYATTSTWKTPQLYITQSYPGKPASFSPAVLARAFAASTEVWITHIDPAQYGYPPVRFVRVPCGESWEYGTLTCMKPAYINDPDLRARDAIMLARTIVFDAAYPKITCAHFLAQMLLQRGESNAADAVMQHLSNFSWSYAAVQAAAAYFTARGNHAAARACHAGFERRTWWRRLPVPGAYVIPAAWPGQFAWFDYTDFGLAADVAGIARPDEWLGPRRVCMRGTCGERDATGKRGEREGK